MNLDRARYLISTAGRDSLASLPPEWGALDPNTLASRLRAGFDSVRAAALAEQLTLRAKASARFGELPLRFLTAEGLEMATHPQVARRRATRLASLSAPVVNLTCGLGGNLAACANLGVAAGALERDPVVALLAAHNLAPVPVVRGDAAHAPFPLTHHAVILDPSRRSAATRRFDPAAFSPDWDTSLALLQSAHTGVLKTAPGIDHRHIPPWAEVEFVQLGRSMREAALWAGARAQPGLRRAVLLPAGISIDSSEPEIAPQPVSPGNVLFDPESCVTRAGVVLHLATHLGARMLDPNVAYLTADEPAFHPMSATFEVLDVVPFSVARLKQRLREKGWSPREIRRRAFPVEPDDLRRLLGAIDGEAITLLLTTLAGRRTAFVGRRLFPQPNLPQETADVARQ